MKTRIKGAFAVLLVSVISLGCGAPNKGDMDTGGDGPCTTAKETGYVPVNGLNMYYEIHGTGQPLVLLHGSMTTIEMSFGKVLPTLSCTRKVIAIEQQAHGRTADIDRTLTYEQMADDTAELLRQLGIVQADFFGYSMGGATALQIAHRHPSLVRKMVVASGYYSNDGMTPETLEFINSIDPAHAEWAEELRLEFQRVAPHPEQWPAPLIREKDLLNTYKGLTPEQVRSIHAPALIIIGDNDAVRIEHAVEMFRFLPHAQLAMFPGTEHIGVMGREESLLSMIPAFLDAPMPEAKESEGP